MSSPRPDCVDSRGLQVVECQYQARVRRTRYEVANEIFQSAPGLHLQHLPSFRGLRDRNALARVAGDGALRSDSGRSAVRSSRSGDDSDVVQRDRDLDPNGSQKRQVALALDRCTLAL